METNTYKMGDMFLDSNNELWFVKNNLWEDILESFFFQNEKPLDAGKEMTFVGNVYDFIKKSHTMDSSKVVPVKTEMQDCVCHFKPFIAPVTETEMMQIFNKDKKEFEQNITIQNDMFPYMNLKQNQRIGDIYWNPSDQTAWILRRKYALNIEYCYLGSLVDRVIRELKHVDECVYIGNILDEVSSQYSSLKSCVTASEIEEFRHKLCQNMKVRMEKLKIRVDKDTKIIHEMEEKIELSIHHYYEHPSEAAKEEFQDYYEDSIRELHRKKEMYAVREQNIQYLKQEIQKFEQHMLAIAN